MGARSWCDLILSTLGEWSVGAGNDRRAIVRILDVVTEPYTVGATHGATHSCEGGGG